jgi:multiple antibiotic resistance protein
MTLVEYSLLAASSLFVIVDPIATIPAFLAMTPHDSPEERVRTAKLATWIMALVLLLFAFTGNFLFRVLGITLPAFQMAASVVLLLVALDMLRARRSRVQETSEEKDARAAKEDVAITPWRCRCSLAQERSPRPSCSTIRRRGSPNKSRFVSALLVFRR